MKPLQIAYLGAGTWGFCLARHLARKGYAVRLWDRSEARVAAMQASRQHPRLAGSLAPENLLLSSQLEMVLDGATHIIESVTSAGVRPVFAEVARLCPKVPIVLTSKGIEQNTQCLTSDIVEELLGIGYPVASVSGPSYAEEVVQELPTAVVAASGSLQLAKEIAALFATPFFRVYPNTDLRGVELGGAMKNVMAIASGISDGLGFGVNARAALITRGLHEMKKLAEAMGCASDTLNGLAGLGDLCLTCMSPLSRNYKMGLLLASGLSAEVAREKIGVVCEGAYTARSASALAKTYSIDLPIAAIVYRILYENLPATEGASLLMNRQVKLETL